MERRIRPQDSQILLVDMQEKLLPGIWEKDTLLQRCRLLLRGAALLCQPVMVTHQYAKGLGETEQSLRQLLHPYAPMDKMSFSCYGDAAIAQALKDSGRHTVVLCGIETHICVEQTALDLLDAGYRVVLLADCVGARKVEDSRIALERMRQAGAEVTTCEALLFAWMQRAGTEQFKQFSRMIKEADGEEMA